MMYDCPECGSSDIARMDERIKEYQHPESDETFETMQVNLICRDCSHEWTHEEAIEEDYHNLYD